MASRSESHHLGVPGADYSAGEVLLGKYRLVELLAVGGMGAVWRACNQLLDCEVAVKVMFQATDSAGVGHRRAHSEARLAAQLNHPAVCRTLDFGLSDRGHPLVISELLHGRGLEDILSTEGPLSATRAAQLILPVLDGLGAAHKRGIVHRDVKPSNLFLACDEAGKLQPMLLDFGIARGIANEQRITVTGVVCGTPAYMSPEQARGSRDVDLRSDIWSMCATLYELVTGSAPFGADNYNAVMFEVIHNPHAPISRLVGCPERMIDIIDRGLSKAPEDRFQSTEELARQLAIFLLSTGIETDSCGHSLRSRLSPTEGMLAAHEFELLQGPHSSQSQLAPTLLRASAPAHSESRVRVNEPRHRAGKTRAWWGIAALAGACLLVLGAVSSGKPRPVSAASNLRGAERRSEQLSQETTPGIEVAVSAAQPRPAENEPVKSVTDTSQATTARLAANKVSIGPSVAQIPAKSGAPLLAASAPSGAAMNAALAAPEKPPPDAQRPARAPAAKSNALGYDFGL